MLFFILSFYAITVLDILPLKTKFTFGCHIIRLFLFFIHSTETSFWDEMHLAKNDEDHWSIHFFSSLFFKNQIDVLELEFKEPKTVRVVLESYIIYFFNQNKSVFPHFTLYNNAKNNLFLKIIMFYLCLWMVNSL